MTVSTTTSKIAYTGNGVTTLYAFPYPFIAASDIQVYVGGVLKALTTDYTISGSAPYPAGANITFVAAPANLTSIVLTRVRPFTQTLDLVPNDPLPADDVERDFDHVVMLAQQLNEAITRSITIPTTDVTGTTLLLPAAALRANQAIIFDAAGNVAVGAVASATVSVAMQPVVAAATLALARIALGIGSNFTTEASIAAAATTDLGSLASQEVLITGNTGITGFGNTASLAAPMYLLRFTGTPTITNSGTMIIAGSANWTVAAGDMAFAKYEGASTWRIFPIKANGQAVSPVLDLITGINGGQIAGFRERVINGTARIAQRGNVAMSNNTFTYGGADRFNVQGSATTFAGTASQGGLAGASSGVAQSVQNVTTTGTGSIFCQTRLEAKDVVDLNSKIVTAYVKLYQDSGVAINGQIQLYKANSLDTFSGVTQLGATVTVSIPSATLTIVPITITLGASDATNGLMIQSIFSSFAAVTNKNFYFADVSLKPSDVVEPFYEWRPIEVELALCQRYYQKTFANGTTPAQNIGTATSEFRFPAGKAGAAQEFSGVVLPVGMRVAPTAVTYNTSAANAQIRNTNQNQDCSGSSIQTGEKAILILATGSAATAVGDFLALHYTLDAEL